MITINGKTFYEEPTSCGTCPFLYTGNTYAPVPVSRTTDKGHCLLWDEMHFTWRSVPRRCSKLFSKAFANYPEGSNLVIVAND